MRDAFMSAPSLALGEQSFTVEASVAAGRTVTDVAGLRGAGFERHRVCLPDTNAFDLARAAVEPLTATLGHLDAIIFATCLPLNGNIGAPEKYQETRDVKYLMDYPGSRLQAFLSQHDAQVIGLNQQACTSMLGSLRLAKALIATDPEMKRILCLTSDRFPEGAVYEQAYNLISDGAAATLVTSEPAALRIVASHQITNGAMAVASDDETVGSYFAYTHRIVQETLRKADLSPAQIDWIIPQNTNAAAWMILSRALGMSFDRVWMPTLPICGHIISGDNMFNLRDLLDTGRVAPGQRLLLLMAGFGMNWQCTVLEAV